MAEKNIIASRYWLNPSSETSMAAVIIFLIRLK
jgi:hypothetical protein